MVQQDLGPGPSVLNSRKPHQLRGNHLYLSITADMGLLSPVWFQLGHHSPSHPSSPSDFLRLKNGSNEIFFILQRNKKKTTKKKGKQEKRNSWKKCGKPPKTFVWWLPSTFTEVAVHFPLVAIQHRAPRVTLHTVHQFKQEFELTELGICWICCVTNHHPSQTPSLHRLCSSLNFPPRCS